MKRKSLTVSFALAICALVVAAAGSHAATIVKLNLGGIGPDVQFSAGTLHTFNDGTVATLGDQNTDVEFTGFLDGSNPDISTTDASFSMSGLAPAGPAATFGPLVIQNFFGGAFTLYGTAPGNAVLLQGTLLNSALTGVQGPPGTGALFTTTFGNITGGSLAPGIVGNSLTLSMNLSNVNGGNGFQLISGVLAPFMADATVNLSADVPEPAAMLLMLAGAGAMAVLRRR